MNVDWLKEKEKIEAEIAKKEIEKKNYEQKIEQLDQRIVKEVIDKGDKNPALLEVLKGQRQGLAESKKSIESRLQILEERLKQAEEQLGKATTTTTTSMFF